MPVPFWLEKEAQQAVAMCPALALRLSAVPSTEAPKSPRTAVPSAGPRTLQLVIPPRELPPRFLTASSGLRPGEGP